MVVSWVCPDCEEIESVDIRDLEFSLYSDPHNPEEDFIRCHRCDRITSLVGGIPVKVADSTGVDNFILESDGYQLYLISGNMKFMVSEIMENGISLAERKLEEKRKEIDNIRILRDESGATNEELGQYAIDMVVSSRMALFDAIRNLIGIGRLLLEEGSNKIDEVVAFLPLSRECIGRDLENYLKGVGVFDYIEELREACKGKE